MKQVIYEVALSVSDYVDSSEDIFDQAEIAFGDACEAVGDAMKLAQGDFPDAKAVSATFLEFDSLNPSHESAYFGVLMEGVTQEEIDALG